MRKTGKPGYVYLVKCIKCKPSEANRYGGQCVCGAYKVGFTTKDLKSRMRRLKNHINGEIEIIDYFWSEDPAREEAEILWTWRQYQIYGEWHNFPDNMVATKEARMPWFSSDEKGFVDSDYPVK